MRVLLSATVLLLAATPAFAGSWNRIEYIGMFAGNGFWGADMLGYGIYQDYYGVGTGIRLAEFRVETWDLPRKGKPDASSHLILLPAPLEARVVLASWEGAPFVDNVESTNARLELHGRFCPWAIFGDMTDVEPGLIGPERVQLNDIVYGSAWDLGISYDAGHFWSATAGRFEFRTRETGVYRARQDGRWYGMLRLYYGRTHGQTVGGTIFNFFHDARIKLCRLIGRCGTIEG